jgi:hypothetical protein
MLAHADTHRQDLRPGCAGMRLPGGGHRRHRPLSQRAQTPMDKLIAGYGCSLGALLSERPPPRDGTASVHSTSGREPCCSTLGPDSVSLWRHRRPVSPTQVSPIQMSRKCRNRCHTWAFNRRADATFEVCVGPPFSFDVAPATPTTLATGRTTTRPHPARCGRPSILAATLRTMNDTEDSYRADRLVDFVHDNQRRTRNRPSPE